MIFLMMAFIQWFLLLHGSSAANQGATMASPNHFPIGFSWM